MTAASILKAWIAGPNSDLVEAVICCPNTTDATNTVAITLSDYGISATGLLSVESWVHTADGSIITTEANTTAVSAGVLTVTIAAGTNDDFRVIRIVGRSDVGAFA